MRSFRLPASSLLVPALLASLLGGCASAPDRPEHLPIEPAPVYSKAELPKLQGIPAQLPGKMYTFPGGGYVAFVASLDNTALYTITEQNGKRGLHSVLQWSVYDKAFCVKYMQTSSHDCVSEQDATSYTLVDLPIGTGTYLERISVIGDQYRSVIINVETGEFLRTPFQARLQPINVPLSDLAAAVAEGIKEEATFQEQVSYVTRHHHRYQRWQAMRDEDRQSSRELNAFMTGLHGELQQMNREADERLDASTASLNATLARIREQERQQQARLQSSGTRSANTSIPAAGSGATRPAATTALVRPAVAATATRTNTATPPENRILEETVRQDEAQAALRRPYLEAVVVCTKPSGANLAFECATPVDRIRGHKNDISGFRSPQEWVARSVSCPARRPLASNTHLVWGCGFGATGGVNALDRGADVSIQGRITYYCEEGQLSCRRTQP